MCSRPSIRNDQQSVTMEKSKDERLRCCYCNKICKEPRVLFPRMCEKCYEDWTRQMDIVETFKADESRKGGE